MSRTTLEPTTAWLRRAPHYLYVSDLVSGRRVLEVGCGAGAGAHFLADQGARHVVGIDASAEVIARADDRFRLSNLEFRREDLDSIELEDATFDCIFVPEGARIVRRPVVLQELRRLLAPRGYLVLSASSADRPQTTGGVSYYELVDRLESSFAPVRMVAQSPFVALSLVEYASGGGPEPAIELDTTLVEREQAAPEVTDYVAICGGDEDTLRGFAIMQLPTRSGLDAVRSALGRAAADGSARRLAEVENDKERAAVLVRELRERVADLEDELERARFGGTGWDADQSWDDERWSDEAEAEFERQLTTALPRARTRADRQPTTPLRRVEPDPASRQTVRVERVEDDELEHRQTARMPRVDDEPLEESEFERQPTTAIPSVAESEFDEALTTAIPRTATATRQIADALEAHGVRVYELEAALEESLAYVDELRDDLDRERERGDMAVQRLLSAQGQLDVVKRELSTWRTRASVAEGQLLRIESQGVPVAASHGDEAGRLRAELDDTRAKLQRATDNWKQAEAKNDEVWRRVGELQTELEQHREKTVERTARQRKDAQLDETHALDDASKKLASIQDELARAERQRAEAETRLEAAVSGREELERHLEEAEEAKAELELRLADCEDRCEELERSPLPQDGTPPPPAPGEGGAEILALRHRLNTIDRQVADGRELLGQLTDGLLALKDADREDAPPSGQQELNFELGIKDAELTLLNVGLSSLQQRLRDAVHRIRQTRDTLAERPAAEIQALMDELADSLSASAQARK